MPKGQTKTKEREAAPPPPVVGEVLQIPAVKRDDTGAIVQFQWNDQPEVLTATRPKQGVLVGLARAHSNAEALGDEAALINVLYDFLDEVFEADTAAHIRAQIESPEAEMDLPDVEQIMQTLMGRWYGRPTTSRGGSSRSPSRTGRASTVRKRSKGQTR